MNLLLFFKHFHHHRHYYYDWNIGSQAHWANTLSLNYRLTLSSLNPDQQPAHCWVSNQPFPKLASPAERPNLS